MTQRPTQRRTPTIRDIEMWKEFHKEEFAYWDLWFLVLAVEHDEGWESIVGKLKSRRNLDTFEREDTEAKLNHIEYLRQRLDRLGLDVGALLSDLEVDKKLLKKAQTKVFDQTVSERDKTPAMKNTPRRLLSTRALRGYWDRFPVSPAYYEEDFLFEIKKKKFYYQKATIGLSKHLERILKRKDGQLDKSTSDKLALYRAFLTAMIEAVNRVDDSFGVMGDLFQRHLPTYLDIPFVETGIKPKDYYRDFLEFTVWENYGLMGSNLDPWFVSIDTNHIALVVSILREIINELKEHEFEYNIEQGLGLLARIFIQQRQYNEFVGLSRELGSRAWEPIITMAQTAWKVGKYEVVKAIFSAADQPGFHQEYLREECLKMMGQLPPKKPHLTVVR